MDLNSLEKYNHKFIIDDCLNDTLIVVSPLLTRRKNKHYEFILKIIIRHSLSLLKVDW